MSVEEVAMEGSAERGGSCLGRSLCGCVVEGISAALNFGPVFHDPEFGRSSAPSLHLMNGGLFTDSQNWRLRKHRMACLYVSVASHRSTTQCKFTRRHMVVQSARLSVTMLDVLESRFFARRSVEVNYRKDSDVRTRGWDYVNP